MLVFDVIFFSLGSFVTVVDLVFRLLSTHRSCTYCRILIRCRLYLSEDAIESPCRVLLKDLT